MKRNVNQYASGKNGTVKDGVRLAITSTKTSILTAFKQKRIFVAKYKRHKRVLYKKSNTGKAGWKCFNKKHWWKECKNWTNWKCGNEKGTLVDDNTEAKGIFESWNLELRCTKFNPSTDRKHGTTGEPGNHCGKRNPEKRSSGPNQWGGWSYKESSLFGAKCKGTMEVLSERKRRRRLANQRLIVRESIRSTRIDARAKGEICRRRLLNEPRSRPRCPNGCSPRRTCPRCHP